MKVIFDVGGEVTTEQRASDDNGNSWFVFVGIGSRGKGGWGRRCLV